MTPELLPSISIVMPCYNEEDCIERCLDSIVENDYPKEKVDVIVVDGMSDDNTRAILKNFSERYSFIRVLDNPKKEIPISLNIGITQACGEIICRMDGHSIYTPDYLLECVKALNDYPADNVGGRWITIPREDTLLGRSICSATSVLFGVGNAYYRLTRLFCKESFLLSPRWEITVAYFCCRREIFEKIGLFNENLDRAEDVDFHRRLRKEGYRTLFVPTITCYYLMRTRFATFLRHMYRNGRWILLPLNYAPHISFSIRHVIPLVFLLSLLGAFMSLSVSVYPLAALFGAYGLVDLFYSAGIAIRERDPRYFLLMPFIFLFLHISYGIGSISGPLQFIAAKVTNWLKRTTKSS